MSSERNTRPRGAGALLLGAALVHLAVMASTWALYTWVYSSPAPPISEPAIWHTTELFMCLGAAVAGTLTASGVWRAAAQSKGWVAGLQIVLVGLPCAFLTCTWLYAVLIFRGWL